jgi:hypothetical protein
MRSIKNKFHEINAASRQISIKDYLEQVYEYGQYPARITNGEMTVCISGHWVTKAEFDSLIPPPPKIDRFYSCTTGIDPRTNYFL